MAVPLFGTATSVVAMAKLFENHGLATGACKQRVYLTLAIAAQLLVLLVNPL
jgi:hypothetical protein